MLLIPIHMIHRRTKLIISTHKTALKREQSSLAWLASLSSACQDLHMHYVAFRNTNMTVLFETEQNDSRKDTAWVPGTAQEQAEASSDVVDRARELSMLGPLCFLTNDSALKP